MAELSHISWTDGTFNPWFGCTEVSNGEKGACTGCYAKVLVETRLGLDVWGPDKPRHRSADSTWAKVRRWNKEPAKYLWNWKENPAGPPADWRPFVFCASLADWADKEVPLEWLRDLLTLIRETPNLTYLLLTKRPGLIVKRFREAHPSDPDGVSPPWEWPPNAAMGCTVVTQAEADRDIPVLLSAAAQLGPAFAFVSMEPLMEAVDLTRLSTMRFPGAERLNALTGELSGEFGGYCPTRLPPLGWVIVGGDTDQGAHKARPTPDGAFESLEDQCAATDTPFQFKQHGEYQTSQGLAARVGKRAPGWNMIRGRVHQDRPQVSL